MCLCLYIDQRGEPGRRCRWRVTVWSDDRNCDGRRASITINNSSLTEQQESVATRAFVRRRSRLPLSPTTDIVHWFLCVYRIYRQRQNGFRCPQRTLGRIATLSVGRICIVSLDLAASDPWGTILGRRPPATRCPNPERSTLAEILRPLGYVFTGCKYPEFTGERKWLCFGSLSLQCYGVRLARGVLTHLHDCIALGSHC
ncbi:hypothetical protein AGLY_008375 [Aphis glycines]|uniref:Uncharacterized protein n=1 Tax=Aphis glycines TaxID=307491 RepID=A0A6G0TMX1_APHGL|nr:hypothetical protein AGLY_008375 [Aphis glycines]